MATSIFTLTKRGKENLCRRYNIQNLKCFRCGEVISVDAEVVSKKSHNNYARPKPPKYYHKVCFEDMFLKV